MNLNKRSTYSKFKEYKDLLSEEVIIYVYAENEEKAFYKTDKIFKYCMKNNIKVRDVYYDISKSKDLIDKPSLAKIFCEEDNIDIISANSRDICPLATGDYFDIRRYLKENNLGVFDLYYKDFYFERAPLLVWSGYCGV